MRVHQNSPQAITENNLTPVTLSGLVTPSIQKLSGGRTSDYTLVSGSGLKYFIMADSEWRDVLSIYCWEEVKIVGLLNVSNMTLIPQLIFPKGSRGNKEKVIDLAEGKSRKTIKKIVKTVNDLVLVPAAIIAVMTL